MTFDNNAIFICMKEVIVKQMDMFFFGEGSAVPKEYVPPAK